MWIKADDISGEETGIRTEEEEPSRAGKTSALTSGDRSGAGPSNTSIRVSLGNEIFTDAVLVFPNDTRAGMGPEQGLECTESITLKAPPGVALTESRRHPAHERTSR